MTHRNITKQKIFIFTLLVLSLTLHLIKLGQIPTFISDEASIGYNAWSVIKTGRDEWGKFMPLTFKAFGEHKLPLYIYFTSIYTFIFGLTKFATRFVSAFVGVLTGAYLYLLAKKLFFKKKGLALIVLFLFVINPWHIQTSRLALEANLALFLFVSGFYLLVKGKQAWAGLVWGLTFYTYNSTRVFLPLFLVLLWAFGGLKFKKNTKVWLVLLLVIMPLVFSGFQGSRERFFKTSIFNDPGLIARIEEKRVNCQTELPFTVCRLVYNRPVVYSSQIAVNYLSHFSPRFLFTQGAGLAQYTMPGFGSFYIFEVLFLLLGFWRLFKDKKIKKRLLPWLVAAPVATSFTGSAHPVRSLILLPCLVLVSGLGATVILRAILRPKDPVLKQVRDSSVSADRRILHNSKNKKYLFVFFMILGFLSLGNFAWQYFTIYPTQTGSVWQSGYQPLFVYLESQEDEFDKIRVTKFYGEPHIFYLFYNQYPPAQYQRGVEVVRYDRQDRWVNVDQIGKYYFFEEPDFQSPGLLVLSTYESQPEMQPEKEINFSNGEVAFKVYRIKNKE